MSLVGLAHFIELTALAVTFILLVRYWWRKCRLSLSDCIIDPSTIVLIGVCRFCRCLCRLRYLRDFHVHGVP